MKLNYFRAVPIWAWSIGLALLLFAVQTLRGATGSLVKLYSWGAFSPMATVEFNQWSRLFTAPFLHFNLAHILLVAGMSLLGGILITKRYSRAFADLIFLVGCGAPMLLSLVLYFFGIRSDGMVFGLLGGAAAYVGVAWTASYGRLKGGKFLRVFLWGSIGVMSLFLLVSGLGFTPAYISTPSLLASAALAAGLTILRGLRFANRSTRRTYRGRVVSVLSR